MTTREEMRQELLQAKAKSDARRDWFVDQFGIPKTIATKLAKSGDHVDDIVMCSKSDLQQRYFLSNWQVKELVGGIKIWIHHHPMWVTFPS